ncbi:MAG: transposase [Lachnospiraceae bacterium]|nr:transposase [Lachnospiraceae bacterium]
MPRKARTVSSSGIYHIILRSVNQHIIFEEDFDYQKFLFVLSDCEEKYDTSIYAYCLMDNHIHMLLRADSDCLSSFFQSLGTRFVRWYNNKYSRCGHLFQDRFYSVAIESPRSFLLALAYIHNNPVKANICRVPSEYRWSSYNAYFGQKNTRIDCSLAYRIAGSKEVLQRFLAQAVQEEDEMYAQAHGLTKHFFTDEAALRVFKKTTNLGATSEAANLTRPVRNNYIRELREMGLTKRQIARLMDVSESTVQRVCK